MNPELVSTQKAEEANSELLDYMHLILKDGRQEVCGLWHKFKWTYWIIVALSVCMFLVGIVLVSVPVWTVYRGDVMTLESLSIAGFGLLDLVTLYFFRPVTRLQTLMGDMGQITIAFSSFQTQVALFLLETDKDDRRTMGKAAQNIGKAACSGVELIQHYFEPEERNEETGSALARRATESIRETSQVLRESLAA
jgi:hypothetical protein